MFVVTVMQPAPHLIWQYIYIYAFSRRFYPKRLTLHSSYSFTFYQLLLSLGIEPMILALLAPCSTIWATGKLKSGWDLSANKSLTFHPFHHTNTFKHIKSLMNYIKGDLEHKRTTLINNMEYKSSCYAERPSQSAFNFTARKKDALKVSTEMAFLYIVLIHC